jgi:hypothetical protein
MIPAGYMFKKVISRPAWLDAADVDDIFSLSGCVSGNFTDYINYWKHNGYWLFNSPAVMEKIAEENNLVLDGMTLFYYEVFEEEFDENSRRWSAFKPELSFRTNVDSTILSQARSVSSRSTRSVPNRFQSARGGGIACGPAKARAPLQPSAAPDRR